MRALARDPRIHCKLSGLLTELSPEERRDPLPALQGTLADLLDWFGPDRLIWGSDWPHPVSVKATPDEGRLLDQLARYAGDDATLRKILVDNPARLFGFDE